MPVNKNPPVGHYHGPPSRNQDIVSNQMPVFPKRMDNTNSRLAQPFHTDNGDIISLFALSRSKSGGSFYLADSTAVYNELAASQPELAQTLCRDWTMIR